MAKEPRWWSDYSRAEKFVLVYRQVVFLVLYGVVAFFVSTRMGVAAVVSFLAPTVVLYGWAAVTMRRRYRRQFPNGREERPDDQMPAP